MTAHVLKRVTISIIILCIILFLYLNILLFYHKRKKKHCIAEEMEGKSHKTSLIFRSICSKYVSCFLSHIFARLFCWKFIRYKKLLSVEHRCSVGNSPIFKLKNKHLWNMLDNNNIFCLSFLIVAEWFIWGLKENL